MRINGFQCEQCQTMHTISDDPLVSRPGYAHWHLPASWRSVIQGNGEDTEPLHFCSEGCLHQWSLARTGSEEPAPKKPGIGILTVQAEALADALCLPEGYQIVGINPNPRLREIDLTLLSEHLPEVPEGQAIPLVSLLATLHTLPDHPEYRYITTEIQL